MIPYYTAIWAIGYAEAINDGIYLPVPNLDAFTDTTTVGDVIAFLENEHPDICFDYGISKDDILHNGIATQIIFILQKIEDGLRGVDAFIKVSPIASELRSYLRYLRPIHPDFRLCGSDGALTELKELTGLTSVKTLAKTWLRNVKMKLEFLTGTDAVVVFPTSKQSLMPSGLVNEKTYFSGMSVALSLKNLASVFIDHHQNEILQVENRKSLHEAQERFFLAYRSLQTTYELRMDYTRDSGFGSVADWLSLQNSIEFLLDVLRFCYYDEPSGGIYEHHGNVQRQGIQGDTKDVRKIRRFQCEKADNNLHV